MTPSRRIFHTAAVVVILSLASMGMAAEPPLEDPNVQCAGEEGDPPILVEIGQYFTIATTTTTSPDLVFCEVLDTETPILPLVGIITSPQTDITVTFMCTVGKDNVFATCQFDITLFGEPNFPLDYADGPDDGDETVAAALDATPEEPADEIYIMM